MLNPKRREWLWPFLGGGLWRFQCECLPIARNHSLHPKSARTPSDPNFSPGIPSVAEAASAQFRRQISLGLITGLIMTSAVPSETGSFCIATQASYLATIMLSLRDKIHSPAEALLKLTLMGRAPARSRRGTSRSSFPVSPMAAHACTGIWQFFETCHAGSRGSASLPLRKALCDLFPLFLWLEHLDYSICTVRFCIPPELT